MSCCDDKSPTCSCEDCTEAKTCLYYDKRKDKRPVNPSDIYGTMINSLSHQESVVEHQKNAYLPLSKESSSICCLDCSKRSKSPPKCTGSQPLDIYELMVETLSRQESAVDNQKRAYLPQSKGSRGRCPACLKRSKRTGSKLPGTYGLMVETLSRQESAVEDQKGAYLTQSEGSCCPANSTRSKSKPSDFYRFMVDTLSGQESAVEDQKSAYLPQSKESESSCCPADSKRSKSKPSDVSRLMVYTLSKQESAVKDQKGAYLPQSKGSRGSCPACLKRSKRSSSKPSGIYGFMVETLSQQESAIKDQKRAYLPQNKERKCICCPESSKRSKCKQSEVYRLMVDTMSRQELAVEKQKSAYLPQRCKGSCSAGSKPRGSRKKLKPPCRKCQSPNLSSAYGIMMDILIQQESAVEVQKNAYITDDSTKCLCSPSGYVLEISQCENKRNPCSCSSKSKSGQYNKQVYNLSSNTSGMNAMTYKQYSAVSKPIKNAPELFKNIHQTQANTYQNEKDECDTWCPQYNTIQYPNNIVSESLGYVFTPPKNDSQCQSNELQEYLTTLNKREPVINTGKVNVNTCQVKWTATDPNGFVLKPHCHDEDLAKNNMFESSGHVVDLPKKKTKRSCSGKKSESCSGDNKSELSGYVLELPINKEKKDCAPCSHNKLSGYLLELPINNEIKTCASCSVKKSELSGYVLELPMSKENKKCPSCGDNKSKSSGYVLELPINKEKKTCYSCSDKKSESSGYLLELPINNEKKTCASCSVKKSELSGNVLELPMSKENKKCPSCGDNKSKSSGYVLELPINKEKKTCASCSDKKSELSGYVLELPINKETKKCASCSDNKLSGRVLELPINEEKKTFASYGDNKSESSGYVLELPISKEKKKCTSCSDNKLSGRVLEPPINKEKKKCACFDKLAEPESQNVPCTSGACIKDLLKFVMARTNSQFIESNSLNCGCNNISLDRRTTSSSGNCKTMTRSKESPCTCSSKRKSGPNNKQVYNASSIPSATSPMTYENCTECSQLKYESPKYSTESRQYKPTKHAQELFRNILQTQAYKYQNERDECDTYTNNIVSETHGYVFELPKYTHNLTLQSDCHSNKSYKSDSKLLGYVPELQGYLTTVNKREPVINTGEVNVNRCQVKWIATDPNRLVLKAQCHDAELEKKNMFESSGYIVEVPKKRKCTCSGNKKFGSCSNDNKSGGYVVELPTLKEKIKCDSCSDKKLESSGYVVELPTMKEKIKCDSRSDNKFESGGYVLELPIVKEKTNCNCNRPKHATETPSEKRSGCTKCASTEFVARAPPKCTENPPSQNNSCVFCKSDTNRLTSTANAQEVSWPNGIQQKSWECADSDSQQYACSQNYTCKMKSNDLAGYVYEVPKHTRNSCTCKTPGKKSNQTEIQYICQSMVGTAPYANHIYTNLCNTILKKQTKTIEGLKEVYLPGKDNKSKTMNFQLNILKNQTDHVAVLKNICLPQQQFELPTKTCCTPLPNLIEPPDGETEILCGEGYKNEYLACEPTKSSKDSSENNICKKQADSVERLKKTCMHENSNDVRFELQTDTCCTPSDDGIEKRSAKEFGGSIESDSSFIKKKISKCDLLKRIRDVYNACSCKICECTLNKTAHECQNLSNQIKSKYEYDECLSHKLSYEMNQWQICGCKPCDCVQCIKTMNVHHCQTLMVTPVGKEENVSRLKCTGSPSPCFDCGKVYPLDSDVENEMSTNINRHALCKCEDCMEDENREYVGGINDLHKFYVARETFDANISEMNTPGHTIPIYDQIHTWKCNEETSHLDLVNSAKAMNENDYERIRNTLKKSKEFSLELITLLNTYEKANLEFESFSETLKSK